jgi:alternative squalene epoxidase
MDVSVTACVWSAILLVPLTLTSKDTYKSVFPSEWYDSSPRDSWNNSVYPSPLGLSLGILAVIVGQISVLIYFWALQSGAVGKSLAIQKAGPPPYNFREGLMIHLSQPEGFVMLGSYLIGTWMFGLMPSSYYSFSGGINWSHVLLQLVAQDCIQCVMHYAEHKLDARIYKASHKPHHKFTNPKLFDAFNGSATGTDHSTSA